MGEPCKLSTGRNGRRSVSLRLFIHLIGGTSTHAVAAVLFANDDGIACWYNRRFVHGANLYLVDLWARYAVSHGRDYATLSADDLRGLA